MNLAGFRDAIAAYFASEYAELNVSTHPGEFGFEDLLRYAKKDPALLVALIKAETDKTLGPDGMLLTARMFAGVLVHDRGDEKRDVRALRIGTYILREVAAWKQRWDISSTVEVQPPDNIQGTNLFSTKLDARNIAMFGVVWDQVVDCTADDATEADDYELFRGEYDLGPTPDDDIDAVDEVDLT